MFPCRMVLKIVLLSSSLSYSPSPKLRILVHTSLKDLMELMNVLSYGAIICTIFFLSRRFISLLKPSGGCTIFGISSAAVNSEARLSAFWSQSFSSSKRIACWMWRCFDRSRLTSNPKFSFWLIASNKLMCDLQATRSTSATERLTLKFFTCCCCCGNIDSCWGWIGWAAKSMCMLFICSVRECRNVPRFLRRSILVILLVLAHFTLMMLVTVHVGIVQILSSDVVKHIIDLFLVLLVASALEPILSNIILGFGLVHSVPAEQVSNMMACWWSFSVAVVPVIMIAIVSEVGIVSEVRLSVLTNFLFVRIIKDRHFGSFGVIHVIVLPKYLLEIFYKMMLPHSWNSSRSFLVFQVQLWIWRLDCLPFGVEVSPLPSVELVGCGDVLIFQDQHPIPNSASGWFFLVPQ